MEFIGKLAARSEITVQIWAFVGAKGREMNHELGNERAYGFHLRARYPRKKLECAGLCSSSGFLPILLDQKYLPAQRRTPNDAPHHSEIQRVDV